MRLRIQTYNPLPDIKAWFIPDVQNAPGSVYDLKEALCLRFEALKTRKFIGKDLVLLLDDFELLNDSPFSAVRDGDLLCVKLSPLAQVKKVEMEIKQVVGGSNITRKRKRKRSESATLLIPGRSIRAPTVLPSLKPKATRPSEESDSESDTSSSSSSSSSTSSSSSIASSSSSTTSSPLKPSTSQSTNQPIDNMTVPNSASRIVSLVPPGLGKPSTHSRNKRRRLKQSYEKETMSTILSNDTPAPPKGSSYTNKLPLGQRKSEPGPSRPPDHTNSAKQPPSQMPSHTLDTCHTQRDHEGPASDVALALNNAFGLNAQGGDISGLLLSGMDPKHPRNDDISDSYITPNQVMMGSLRNKNKKKGFKLSMAGPIPQKITFTANTMESGSQQLPQDMSVDEPSTSSGIIQPRLIPPSVIQELGRLPPNMFVTSVDVESEMWKSPKKKGLNGGHYAATTDWHDSRPIGDITYEATENGQFDDAQDGSVALPYLDAEPAGTASEDSRPFDWDRAETVWNECAVLEKLEQLEVGCLVGWKGLAMNPQTSSPEILLRVGRVVNIRQGSPFTDANKTQNIIIRYLQRPGAGRAALAFGLNGVIGFNDEEQVEDEEETVEWTHLAKQWRLVKL